MLYFNIVQTKAMNVSRHMRHISQTFKPIKNQTAKAGLEPLSKLYCQLRANLSGKYCPITVTDQIFSHKIVWTKSRDMSTSQPFWSCFVTRLNVHKKHCNCYQNTLMTLKMVTLQKAYTICLLFTTINFPKKHQPRRGRQSEAMWERVVVGRRVEGRRPQYRRYWPDPNS